jgi:ubiquinone/menaquinone biosynthesis C-methylase UbiE
VIGIYDQDNTYTDSSQKSLLSGAVRLEPHFKVLDYGCGVGRWTLWFARQVQHVIGVDISPKMVEAAWQAADEAGISNAEHRVIEGIPLPFEDGAFDLVNAVWVLRYVIDEDELVRTANELCRVVRPGGYITFIEMIATDQPEFRDREGEFSGPTVYRRWDQYRSLFEDCGMTMKGSTIASASPLYWSYVNIGKTAKRLNLPNPLLLLTSSIVPVSLAGEVLTTRLMQFLADHRLIHCRHRFYCFQKPESACSQR